MTGIVSDADEVEIVRLLTRDVEATLGSGHEAEIRHYATSKREFADDLRWYRHKVVEEVQQYFHDLFIHTTWPPCPRHPGHPLWLHREFWTCEQDQVPVARLGELERAG